MRTIALQVRVAMIAMAAVVVGGCEEPTDGLAAAMEPSYAEGSGALVEPVSTSTPAGYVNEYLAEPVTVQIKWPTGQPARRIRVDFTVQSGGGSVNRRSVLTDSRGMASTRWRLGSVVGTQVLRAYALDGSTDFTATASSRDAVPVTDVEVTPGTVSLDAIGAVQQLAAHAFDANGNVVSAPVSYRTINAAVATVDAAGVVRAVANGSTLIIAEASGLSDTSAVTVAQRVASVGVTPALDTLAVGEVVQLAAAARDRNGHAVAGMTATWSSENSAIASVSTSGAATGRAAGTTRIAALVDGVSGSATVVVRDAATPPPPPPPPPPSGLLFHSDWSTGTGTSLSALMDGGKWTDYYCNSIAQVLTVVDGQSVGWTGPGNVLRIQQRGTTCGMLEAQNVAPRSTHWGRFYFRNDETQTRHNHVSTYNPLAPIQLALWNRVGGPDGVMLFMRTYFGPNGVSTPYPYYLWELRERLPNGRWYRYEWMMEYVTPTTYRIWPRVYDMAETLLYDADDWVQADYVGQGHTLQSYYAAGNVFGFSDSSLAVNFGLGQEGPATTTSTLGYWYHANVALSSSGWIGQ